MASQATVVMRSTFTLHQARACHAPPPPPLAQDQSPNAYTLAIAGRKPFIVVHTALLELLSLAEVQAVIAHELGVSWRLLGG